MGFFRQSLSVPGQRNLTTADSFGTPRNNETGRKYLLFHDLIVGGAFNGVVGGAFNGVFGGLHGCVEPGSRMFHGMLRVLGQRVEGLLSVSGHT